MLFNDLVNRIHDILDKDKLDYVDLDELSTISGALSALQMVEKENTQSEELADIFPSLKKYQDEHNVLNLKKLCIEIVEFCQSVYASTENQEERDAYKQIMRKVSPQ